MSVLEEISAERNRQKGLEHGGNTDAFDEGNTRNDWIAYITGYAGRAAEKLYRNEREGQDFRANMIKVGALVVAAIESHDKGNC